MMTLYDFNGSGNGFKVRLLLAQLGIAYTLVERDILKGETRTPEFLAKNPNGRIPTLELDDGTFLAESDAILWYLAEGTKFAPADRLERARTLQWMFFEQYSHEPYIAVLRFWLRFAASQPEQAEIDAKRAGGTAALEALERALVDRDFLVGERYSIADIALYGYTHVAQEGGFLLDNYPHVASWLSRVAQQPGYVSM